MRSDKRGHTSLTTIYNRSATFTNSKRIVIRVSGSQLSLLWGLDFNISQRLPDSYNVFQTEVIVIYRAAQWILAYGVPFIHNSIFFNSQAAIKSLSNVKNTSRIVRKCLRCLNDSVSHLSGPPNIVTFRETEKQMS